MAGTIWVVVQLRDGGLHPMAREALAAGQQLAAESGGEAAAVAMGAELDAVGSQLAGLDLAAVHLFDHPALASYTPGAYVGTLAPAIEARRPALVLFPHTYQTLDYMPRLGQELGAAVVTEVTAARHDGDGWLWRRPVFGGKLQSEVRVKGEGPVLVSLQSGAFAADGLAPGSATVSAADAGSPEPDRELLGIEEVAGEHVDLSVASAIVAVGRGIGGAERMALVEELAAALGAEIGASRPVIDSGWLPRDRQIGSSGQTVAPKLYVAAGISGAIQHLVGMKGSQVVVAINKDANAPIFVVADYGWVGDLGEFLPAFTAAVREAKG